MSLYNYKAQIVNVVDADTLDVVLDLGIKIKVDERIRVARIDAPERFTDEGKVATKYVHDMIERYGSAVYVKTFKDKKCKFGRYIGEITWQDAGLNLSDALVANGHAVYVDY